jgi:AcrR family transcriptional regulator
MTSIDERPAGTADTLPERVRTAIRAAAVSQREVAHRVGTDPTALPKALRGTRRLRDEEIAALAKACGVSTAYLVEGTGPEPVLPPETGRDRAQPVTAQERRDQIQEAATVLIARRGYHNVRVSDIARYCGTSTATVRYHFPSKEATLRAALEYYAQRFRTRLDEEFGRATSARHKLRRLVEMQLPLAADDIDEWSVWIQFWNQAMLEPLLRPAQRRIHSGWYGLVPGRGGRAARVPVRGPGTGGGRPSPRRPVHRDGRRPRDPDSRPLDRDAAGPHALAPAAGLRTPPRPDRPPGRARLKGGTVSRP